MVFLVLISLLAIFWLVQFLYFKWNLQKIKIQNLNNFPFLIEIFYPIIKIGISSDEARFKILTEYGTKFPDMMKLWFGPNLVVFVNRPDRIQKVLLAPQCLEKLNFIYKLMERDHGLTAASTKNKWKEHRKLLNFSFSMKVLDSFLPTFGKYAGILCDQLMNEANGEEFNFFEYAKRSSFDVLCATTLGTDIRGFLPSDEYEKIFNAYEV